jgi:3-oxoacyl-[acyl-carrier protein] reductase
MVNTVFVSFEDLFVGQIGQLSHKITAEEVRDFIELTGDSNPIHHDKLMSSKITFGQPVVHGMLTASFISTLIGTILPGPGSLWISQSLDFVSPVFIGENLTVKGKIMRKSPGTRIVVIETIVEGEANSVKIRGEAKVKILM